MVFSSAGPAFADSFDDQIAALKQQMSGQAQQAASLHTQANDYRSKVAELQAQSAALQTQINLNQALFNKVTANIAENEAKLAEQKTVLAANLKSMYLDSNVTPIEMLASSHNISEFLDQQQYQDRIKTKIQSAMADIQTLQQQLQGQREQVASILSGQKLQQQQLIASRNEINQLLALAQQNAGAADQQVKDSNTKIASLKSQQAAILAASSRSFNGSIPGASGGSGGACDNGHGNGGYPMLWCNAAQDYPGYGGPWGYNRECVSWAGWRRQQMGHPVYAWGNANQWDDGARNAGYRVDSSPEVGAVAQTDAGYFGHVTVVEAIQGSNVIVSEMNYDGDGHFRYGSYPATYFKYIH
ncbi:MAG TPA: CHAP domain-containing protein [Candidatus Saccharimonadia bacterium]|nr:CHAP domain-containing protein [Candidatus Saccharimonadia bacterium]